MSKQLKRAMASFLAVLMVIGLLPANLITVYAEEAEASGLVWDLSGIEAGSKNDPFEAGGFTITPGGSEMKVEAVSEDAPVYSDEGKQFSYYLSLGGSGNTGKRVVSFTVGSASKVTIWARKGGAGDARKIAVANAEGVLTSLVPNESTESTLTGLSVDVPAGTYYLYSENSGINIFDIVVKSNLNLDLTDVEANDSIVAPIQAGDFEILAKEGKAVKIEDISGSPVTSDDGKEFTKAVNLNGSGALDNRAIKFSLPVTTTLNVYALSGSGTDTRTLKVVDGEGADVTTISAAPKASSVNAAEVTLKAGTYYMYSAGSGITVYGICVKEEAQEVTPWEDVPTPKITSVEEDAEGNLVVSFEAVIGKYNGAESVQIVMREEGYEFSSATVTSQSTTSVTFTPIWSGDYTFQAVARRSGEADKLSEVFAFNGYVLPVKKPILELVQNRGDGAVYLDWINPEAADFFRVSYKESSASDYTVAEENNEKGYATLNLTAGKTYDFKIDAVRSSDNYTVSYEYKNFEVTANAEQKWYFGTVGSAQETHATVTNADGSVAQQVDMETKDTIPDSDKQGIMAATVDIVNTDKAITFAATGNGKISDGEEGFQYFYTMINPNEDNFKLTATFELTEKASGTLDNQSGYGIIATDMLGYNYYETEGLWIKCKQLNSVSTQMYSPNKANFVGMRNISGYVSVDTTSVEDVTRETFEQKFAGVEVKQEIGTGYTFTLEKTNDGYISRCGDTEEEIKYEDLSILSVQEDGSLCIGVFASRNAGVKITNITFETSESTGITAVDKDESVTPSVAVLSSGTTNTNTYRYIYHPNVAGKLTVTAPDGTTVFDQDVAAYDVVKVDVPVAVGENEVKSTLVPDSSQNLTNYDSITKTTKVSYQVIADGKTEIYVSPSGSAAGDGSKENPLDVNTAVSYAAPGTRIVMLNGTYTKTITIGRSVCGTSDKHITLTAEEVNGVILEGVGITVIGDYWDIYGIYVHYPSDVGIQISGNYNTIEMCTVEGSGNTGVQISRSGSVDREPALKSLLWPSYNLVKNCESFDNCDAGRNDADGFAAKLTSGDGNKFFGCIAHNNIDDGWDLFAKAISGEIGTVIIENCVAYNNGWLTTEDPESPDFVGYGEGNGFKLGGNDMYGGHILRNSVSFGNIGKGITSNSCPDCKVYMSTAYGNAAGDAVTYNVSLQTKASNHQRWEVEGLISVTSFTDLADQMPFSLRTENNYIYDGSKSYNSKSVVVSDDWFESVDLSIVPTRNADGSIDMHGLLVPTDKCPADAGGRLDIVLESDDDNTGDNEDEITTGGLGLDENGVWAFYNAEGTVDTTVTGLVPYDGTWFYVSEGYLDQTVNGFVEYDSAKFYVGGGQLQKVNGLIFDNDKWYYVADGQLQSNYSGLVEYYGEWFVLLNGIVDNTYNGFITYDGAKFLVADGRLVMEYYGLYLSGEKWYLIAGGQFLGSYTGLTIYSDAWFYLEDGILAEDFTGWVDYDGSSFYVVNGMIR